MTADNQNGGSHGVTGSGGAAMRQPNPANNNVASEKSTTSPPSSPTPPAPKPSVWSRVKATCFPPWLVAAWHSRQQWKNFFRSMVALTGMVVLMVAKPSLDRLGQATFFGLILICMATPSMPVSVYLFMLVTIGLGMLLGWAIGCAAWAAGLDVRSQARYQRTLQEEQTKWDPNLPVAINMQKSIFSGAFLDPRSSAVFGVFLFLGTYAIAWLRAKRPKLVFLTIFSSILLDMMTTFGPLFPTAKYDLATVLIKPGAAGMAMGLVCCILFFPQTLNHLILGALIRGGLHPILGLLKLQDEVLKTCPSNHEAWTPLANRASALRRGFAAAATALAAQSKLLHLEISHGRISAGQLAELITRTRTLGERALGLGSFVRMVEERHQGLKKHHAKPLPHSTSVVKQEALNTMTAEYGAGGTLDELMPELASSTAELRQAAQEALQGVISWLELINRTRWKKTPPDAPTSAARDAARERLATVLQEYRSTKHFLLLSRFEDLFDMTTGELKPVIDKNLFSSVRALFRCFVFTSSLIGFCVALIDYLEFIRIIELSCPKNKFQFPGKFVQSVVENANDSEVGDNSYNVGGVNNNQPLEDNDNDADDPDLVDDNVDPKTVRRTSRKVKWNHDPDARNPTNVFQKLARLIDSGITGLTGTNGMFALRYGLVSVAMWTPAVCHSSAKFYYENRGLWALIMSQTGLGVMSGEQFANMIWRTLGTGIGVVAGMVIWYIGAQKGTGNPYGIAVATVVGTAPFMWIRVASPLPQMGFWILTAVTVVFVVGYSWVDMNFPQLSDPGSGAALAGKRALLVVIGFAAGFIIVLLPRPISAKKLVREGFSKNILGLAALYGLQNAAFELSRDDSHKAELEERSERYRNRLLKIFGRLGVIEHRMGFASMEPNLKGAWPKKNYEALLTIQSTMLASFATMGTTYAQLNTKWIHVLTERVDVLHPTFTADVFALFNVLRHSLRSGVPLPPTIPIFERLIQYRRGKRLSLNSRYGSRLSLAPGANASTISIGQDGNRDSLRPGGQAGNLSFGDSKDSFDYEAEVVNTDRALWDMFRGVLNWNTCHDEQFALFATVLISHMHILNGLNSIHAEVLDLVGERELEGFDMAQERWATMRTV